MPKSRVRKKKTSSRKPGTAAIHVDSVDPEMAQLLDSRGWVQYMAPPLELWSYPPSTVLDEDGEESWTSVALDYYGENKPYRVNRVTRTTAYAPSTLRLGPLSELIERLEEIEGWRIYLSE